jgi:hypothetical protein
MSRPAADLALKRRMFDCFAYDARAGVNAGICLTISRGISKTTNMCAQPLSRQLEDGEALPVQGHRTLL